MPAFDFEIVYLARHGETEWNREGRRQGRLDSPLTQNGWDQAQRLARFVTTLSPTPDGLSSSPLGRAIATAEVCSNEIGLQVVVVDDLAELDHGRITGMTSSDVDEAFPGELERREEDKYAWRFPGGESYSDVDARAARALHQIGAAGAKRPLIVSHAMISRMLRRDLLGADPGVATTWRQPHDVIFEVDVARRKVVERPF